MEYPTRFLSCVTKVVSRPVCTRASVTVGHEKTVLEGVLPRPTLHPPLPSPLDDDHHRPLPSSQYLTLTGTNHRVSASAQGQETGGVGVCLKLAATSLGPSSLPTLTSLLLRHPVNPPRLGSGPRAILVVYTFPGLSL